jgi:6-phosphogluconolactonase (cycloisomerase 2 family)
MAKGGLLLVGTYAKHGGPGVRQLRLRADGTLAVEPEVLAPLNASHGTWSSRHGLHYLVDEQTDGALGAYVWREGRLECLARLPTMGAEPCFVALSPEQDALAVANYASGSCAVFPLHPATGLPLGPPQVRQNLGAGADPERQGGPHAHCAVFSPCGCWLFQTDLGTDQVLAFAREPDTGELGPPVLAYRARPGSGPRHLRISPDGSLAVLVSELDATLTVLAVKGSMLSAIHTTTTLPGRSAGNLGGHLEMSRDWTRVYVSNRGDDSVVTFSLGPDGQLDLEQRVSSGGSSPRQFLVVDDGATIMVAHEKDGAVRVLRADPAGQLALIEAGATIPGAAFIFPADPVETVP